MRIIIECALLQAVLAVDIAAERIQSGLDFSHGNDPFIERLVKDSYRIRPGSYYDPFPEESPGYPLAQFQEAFYEPRYENRNYAR